MKNSNRTQLRNASLEELVKGLQSEKIRKRDFIVSSTSLSMNEGKIIVKDMKNTTQSKLNELFAATGIPNRVDESIRLEPLDVCHDKIAEKLGIPKKYYERMQDTNPELLDANVSSWFTKGDSKRVFVRTFIDEESSEERSGIIRTICSDRFSVIDNLDVCLTVLDTIKNLGLNVSIDQCDITDKRFYMRVVCPEIEMQATELVRDYRNPVTGEKGEVNTGLISGFVISNSEIGYGSLQISPRAVLLVCKNGLVRKDESFKRTHLGGKIEDQNGIIWNDRVREKNIELIQAQVRQAIETYSDLDYLNATYAKFAQLAQEPLAHPVDCTKNICTSLSMSDEKAASVLDYFLQSGMTKVAGGISQALTFHAHETENADEQFSIESVAFELLSSIKSFDKPVKNFRKTSVKSLTLTEEVLD